MTEKIYRCVQGTTNEVCPKCETQALVLVLGSFEQILAASEGLGDPSNLPWEFMCKCGSIKSEPDEDLGSLKQRWEKIRGIND